MGCDTAQGYYVGKPLPVADYPAWAAASRWSRAGPRDAGHASATR
jgi:EAL domain-containing protein (putative c-di-GMP-specific phosphodiesterase class I)